MTSRLSTMLGALREKYSKAFPGSPEMRIGVIVEPRNGASGYWTAAKSKSEGPIFIIEVDPAIEQHEEVLAHELAHPIIRLLGVPSGQSTGQIDPRIGHEFISTSHHPYVFDLLERSGYGAEQHTSYTSMADEELTKLAGADFSSTTYVAPPGQTHLALWYFNFFLLARSKYDAIRAVHKERAPQIADKMDRVSASWMAATKGTGAMKRGDPVPRIRAFQSHLFRALDLEGRVALQSFEQWRAWLFQSVSASRSR